MNCVLLALHYQNDVLHPDGKIRVGVAADSPARAGLIAAAGRLLEGARQRALPVISVRIAFRPDYRDVTQNCPIFRHVVRLGAMQEGSWGARFYAGLEPRGEEIVIQHNRVNAFYGTALEQVLYGLGARRLIMAGVATHSVVEHSARHAADIGYEVLVAADACSAGDRQTHEASLRSMALIATVADTASIYADLDLDRPAQPRP